MDAAIFGLIVADLIAEPFDLRHPPAPGGLVLCNSIQLTTGGNVCNSGIAMAKLGMKVAAAGTVGNDVLGSAVIERLTTVGVDTTAVFRDADAQTAATVVAVEPGGERCFFHTVGANKGIDADLFRRCIPVLARCAWVQIGYFGLLQKLVPDLPACLAELRKAAPGVKIAFDTVNPPGTRAELDPILPHLDLFAPSRTEAAGLTGETDPKRMVASFRRQMPRGIIGIKLDAEGCLLDDGDHAVFVPACKVDVVDTTGAGDSWFGGLLTGLIKQMPLEQAGRFANRVAADCCTALGASAGIRSFDETMARMK
ncbi:carbohydrate kinase family protein [Humisphaera borealis]|uniref:Carbohydrate kinase family protein n=1 Tax=Humisphaera borealis TaxID=2807512 RepID=A0A7M2WTY0_9BACT|nr:carbohydrate kinase family protein [Humisphaera borealis]QOV88261.1 carbohydrate kinase family protein [Humisphaera borealis]